VHGLRGDDAARTAWIEVVHCLTTPDQAVRSIQCYEFFDALLMLHRGQLADALRLLNTPPEDFRSWNNGQWRPWYSALWADTGCSPASPALRAAFAGPGWARRATPSRLPSSAVPRRLPAQIAGNCSPRPPR
jgi:hypothetical protein